MCFVTLGTRCKGKAVFVLSAAALTLLTAVIVAFCCQKESEPAGYSFDLGKTGGIGGFLSQFSLEYDTQLSSREITFPDKDDQTFVQYNNLQSKIGLNVLKFSGKKVEERYLKLKNKTKSGNTLYSVVYIYKDKVVACHLTAFAEDSELMPIDVIV